MSERPRPMTRSEEDLRAAFRLAAQDAPATEDVLAKMRAAQTRDLFAPPRAPRSRVRQWLPIAAVAAVVIAIAVPVGFAVSDSGNGAKSSSAGESFAASAPAAAGASSAAGGEIAGPGAVGGPINTAPVSPVTPGPSPAAGPVCTTDELALTMTWTAAGAGLRGTLTARNIGGIACNLAIKPAIYPLGPDRVRLNVSTVMTAEGYAGPSLLQPGATASSTITWNSWCGAPADSGAQIVWDGQGEGPATISVIGPTSPSCVGGKSGSISSTWFGPLS
jgi:hypothetical protein